MSTYKIGNSITAVIRAYASTTIGNTEIEYDNQPYTIVTTDSATITFDDNSTVVSSRFNEFHHTAQQVTEVKVSDTRLTDRIMNLLFPSEEVELITKIEHHTTYMVGDNEFYLTTTQPEVYQLFAYRPDQKMVYAAGTFDTSQSLLIRPYDLLDDNQDLDTRSGDILVCYQESSTKTYNLKNRENCYFTLDLITTLTENNTTKQATIHLENVVWQQTKDWFFRATLMQSI